MVYNCINLASRKEDGMNRIKEMQELYQAISGKDISNEIIKSILFDECGCKEEVVFDKRYVRYDKIYRED